MKEPKYIYKEIEAVGTLKQDRVRDAYRILFTEVCKKVLEDESYPKKYKKLVRRFVN